MLDRWHILCFALPALFAQAAGCSRASGVAEEALRVRPQRRGDPGPAERSPATWPGGGDRSAAPVVGVSAEDARLQRWVHGQLHAQRCRLPTDTLRRPVGLYLEDRHPRRQVVLTFDDGPLRRRTDRILDLLAKHRIKATFFVVGAMIHAGTFRTVQRIVREGHILGNHAYHHRTRLAKRRKARALFQVELQLTQALVDIALLARSRKQFGQLRKRLLGGETRSRFPQEVLRMWPVVQANWRAILRERGRKDGRSPYRMRYARPPGGNPLMGRWTADQRRAYAAAAQGLGLVTVLWSSASADSTPSVPKAQRRDGFVVSGSILRAAHRGGVLLLHDWMNLAHLRPALATISASRRLRVLSLHRLVRQRFGCEPSWLSHVVRAREGAHRRAERARGRRSPLQRRRRARATHAVLRPVRAPAPAPPPPAG